MKHNGPYPIDPAIRFWAKVEKSSDCWVWVGAISDTGYGALYRGSERLAPRMIGAHRFSWELHNGPVPDGLLVLHRCDNRRCVRPDHLFVGTEGDNIRDAVAKGRVPLRVSSDQVREMRRRWASGSTTTELAARYGLARGSVHRIVTGKSRTILDETA